MSKSILIFGKGPSLLRCTKEFVDEFDDIAICNYPVLNDFFKNLIKNREIKYHFANCGTFDERYTDKINKQLKIQNIYNTNKKTSVSYYRFLKDKSLFRENIREPILKYFLEKYNLDPNSGTMALKYILDLKEYDKIGLAGFDNFKKGEQQYYYKPNEYNNKIKYILNDKIVKKNGIYNQISGHCPIKSKKYYEDVFKNNSNIEFKLISNINFNLKLNNFILFDK